MSDSIGHECGIAMLRLKAKRSAPTLSQQGLLYMTLLMEKMHNRGQDGAGLVALHREKASGFPLMHCVRSADAQPIRAIFKTIDQQIQGKDEHAFPTESHVFMGHVRYATFGRSGLAYCHPFIREHAEPHRMLALAGNFNLTNVPHLIQKLKNQGLHLSQSADTYVVTTWLANALDLHGDLEIALEAAVAEMDGGFVLGGVTGNDVAFILRDAHGIRPGFYVNHEDYFAAASERAVLQTVFKLKKEDVHEIPPGHVLISHPDGTLGIHRILPEKPRKACAFERIYFSRGTDADIYKERKALGYQLTSQVLSTADVPVKELVCAFVPNTAEVAFYGLMEGLQEALDLDKSEQLSRINDREAILQILKQRPRTEKIIVKDAKLRTFISDDIQRKSLAQHVYDITYEGLNPGKDTLIIVDDSIVRGTTLRESILRMLDRLEPKHIVVVSSAPPILFPDCYGIDMARLDDLLAFQALLHLLRTHGQEQALENLAEEIRFELKKPEEEIRHLVPGLYQRFSMQQLIDAMAELVTPEGMGARVSLVFQTVEDLHTVCQAHQGDWYFTGAYPTPGGRRTGNQAFLDFFSGKQGRPYGL